MKNLPFILLLVLGFYFAAPAQKTQVSLRTRPASVALLAGEYPDKLFANKALNARFKKLLGKNYATFMESFETNGQFEKKGNFLFSSGCLIHACGHLESAIAVDLVNHTIHAAIFRENEPAKYFNEDRTKTPESVKEWIKQLTVK